MTTIPQPGRRSSTTVAATGGYPTSCDHSSIDAKLKPLMNSGKTITLVRQAPNLPKEKCTTITVHSPTGFKVVKDDSGKLTLEVCSPNTKNRKDQTTSLPLGHIDRQTGIAKYRVGISVKDQAPSKGEQQHTRGLAQEQAMTTATAARQLASPTSTVAPQQLPSNVTIDGNTMRIEFTGDDNFVPYLRGFAEDHNVKIQFTHAEDPNLNKEWTSKVKHIPNSP